MEQENNVYTSSYDIDQLFDFKGSSQRHYQTTSQKGSQTKRPEIETKSISNAFPKRVQFMQETQKNVNMPKFITKGFQNFSYDHLKDYQNAEQLVSKWPPTKSSRKEGNIKHLIDLFGESIISQYQKKTLDSQIQTDQIEKENNEKQYLGKMKSYINRKIMRKIIKQREAQLVRQNKKIHNSANKESNRKSRISYMLNLKGFAIRLCNPKLIQRIQSR